MPPYKNRSYAYCSDTGYYEKIIPIIKNVDILYHEATFDSDKQEIANKTGHSTSIDAATIAKKANVETLLMGHFSARYKTTEKHVLQAKKIFENTYAVNDGDEFQIQKQIVD